MREVGSDANNDDFRACLFVDGSYRLAGGGGSGYVDFAWKTAALGTVLTVGEQWSWRTGSDIDRL